MISENDKNTIVRFSKGYGVEYVVLFGSAATKDKEFKDIDIGVKGIEPRLFFKFYADIFRNVSKTVNLIDLSRKSLFNDLVEKDGIRIYG